MLKIFAQIMTNFLVLGVRPHPYAYVHRPTFAVLSAINGSWNSTKIPAHDLDQAMQASSLHGVGYMVLNSLCLDDLYAICFCFDSSFGSRPTWVFVLDFRRLEFISLKLHPGAVFFYPNLLLRRLRLPNRWKSGGWSRGETLIQRIFSCNTLAMMK